MKRRQACLILGATPAMAADFSSKWPDSSEQVWLGPEYWANRLQDWRLRNGRIECFVSGGDRNVFLLTHEVTDQPGALSMRVRLGRLEEDRTPLERGFAGFRVGVHGRLNDYRDSAVYGIGLNAGLATDGRLFIGKLEANAPSVPAFQDLELALEATPTGATCQIRLTALNAAGK